MGFDQPSHWLVIVVIAALLFGYKKLPEMARSAGRSMRIFKTEIKGMADDDEKRGEAQAEQEPAQLPPAQPQSTAPVTPATPAASSAPAVSAPAARTNGAVPATPADAPAPRAD